jgi:hypothetical protein
MMYTTVSRRTTTIGAALLAFGVAACTSGESSDAPGGERMDAAAPETEAVVSVPAGTVLAFRVQDTVTTESHDTGDVFTATLYTDVTTASGDVLVPAGTRSRWMVTEASSDAGPDGQAVLAFRLEAVELGGEWTPIQATVTDTEILTSARDSNTETVAKVAIGAAAGAILGQIIGKDTESTLKGAGVGAAVGTAVALTTRGSKATLPAGSTITVRLDEPVTIG